MNVRMKKVLAMLLVCAMLCSILPAGAVWAVEGVAYTFPVIITAGRADIVCEDGCSYTCTDNGSGTHTKVCSKCGYEVREGHSYADVWSGNIVNHWRACQCGDSANTETHKDDNKDHKCDVCGLLYGADVYVAGKGLQPGQYMDADGSITNTQPNGGYAYYQDGILELHNYNYNGEVQDWYSRFVDYESESCYTAVIFSAEDIIIEVYGENYLTNAYAKDEKVEGAWHNGDGIASGGNIQIVGGSGTRNDVLVLQGSFGIMTEYGGVEISNMKELQSIARHYDGIYSYGDIYIHGNDNVTVNACRDGIYTMQGDIRIQGTSKVAINANSANHYDVGETYAIFASKDTGQGTPEVNIDSRLAIVTPENAAIDTVEKNKYSYTTVFDGESSANHVVIEPLIANHAMITK